MSKIEKFTPSKFGDYLEEFPKSKIPSGKSKKKRNLLKEHHNVIILVCFEEWNNLWLADCEKKIG